jgi:superfamily II DNA or RNA helicase
LRHHWKVDPDSLTMDPRPYQRQTLDAIAAAFLDWQKVLAVLPTGSGKTCIFSWLAAAMQPGRTLILAHREELIDQALEKLHAATGIRAEKEMAEHRASREAPVVVASVQTMGRRLARWPAEHFRLVVADEAHHAISDSWRRVLGHFDAGGAKVLGVTATPDRGDRRALGEYFEHLAIEIRLQDLIRAGFLVPIKIAAVPLKIALDTVTVTAGDLDAAKLGDALAPYLDALAAAIRDHAPWRRTLAFLPLIATSQAFVTSCRRAGLRAAHIDGGSNDRAAIRAAFAAGDFDLVSNAMLWTEGFDDPSIDAVAILRPTKSRPLYAHMVGRGTRIAPGKKDLLLLDFLWLHEKHRLIRPAHLVAPVDEVADAITAKAFAAGGGELDLEAMAGDATAEREARLLAELKAKAKRKSRTIDAIEYCLRIGAGDVAEFEPLSKADAAPQTDRQAEFLTRQGIDPESVRGKGHASAIIGAITERLKLDLASPRQANLMRQLGHPAPYRASRTQAAEFLARRIGPKKPRTKSDPTDGPRQLKTQCHYET